MRKDYSDFLMVYSAAIKKNVISPEKIEKIDLDSIYHIANEQGLTAIVYGFLKANEYFTNTEVLGKMRNTAMLASSQQVQKFHHLFEFLSLCRQENITVCVIKGIVLSQLYPMANTRVSGDIDILMSGEDLEKVYFIAEKLCSRIDEKKDNENVLHVYLHGVTHLEIHTSLFNNDFDGFDELTLIDLNDLDIIKTDAGTVPTLKPTAHMLYLICHTAHHFLGHGTGLRQLSDCALFADYYFDEIDWDFVLENLERLSLGVFAQALFYICIYLFGANEKLPTNASTSTAQRANALLVDCLNGGVFGRSSSARTASTSLANSTNNKHPLLRVLFPKSEVLKERYPYAEKKIFLLPIAWFNRVIDYFKKGQNSNPISQVKESFKIGHERRALFELMGVFDKSHPTVYKSTSMLAPLFIQLLDEGYEISLPVSGGSMMPFFIHDRDTVILKKPEKPLKRGDVVLFSRASGILIMHRILFKKKRNFYIAGDAQNFFEGPVAEEQIHAIAIKRIRDGKKTTSLKSLKFRFLSSIWRWLFPFRWLKRKLFGKEIGHE